MTAVTRSVRAPLCLPDTDSLSVTPRLQEKRKTINGEDILFAMSSLGFDNYVAPLKLYLNKYRDAQKGEKGSGTGAGAGGSGTGAGDQLPSTDDSSLNNDQSFSAGDSISFFLPSSQVSS